MSRSVSRISRPVRILFFIAIAITLVIWLLLFLVTDLHVGITRNINLTTNNATNFGKSDVLTPMTRDSSSQYINLSLYTVAQQASEALPIIPSSWQDLNEQMFCKIDTNNQFSDGMHQFLRSLFDIQFNADCTSLETKFIIYNIALEAKTGFGSSITNGLKRILAVSMMLNRTLLLTGKHDWSYDLSYCTGYDAMECYFVPISNCNALDILSQINTSDPTEYHIGAVPKHCHFGNKNVDDLGDSLPECTERVIHLHSRRKHGGILLLNREISHWIRKRFKLRMMPFEAVVAAFFSRPQPAVRAMIYQKIQKSIVRSLETVGSQIMDGSGLLSIQLYHVLHTVPTNTIIAYPIRASDKCNDIHQLTGKRYTHKPEIDCFSPEEHVRVMNAIKYLTDGAISTVILTSEDDVFLDKVVEAMSNNTVSNVSEWNIIRNTEDFSVGEGTTTYRQTVKWWKQPLQREVGTSLETDHMVSALSSLIMQVHLEPEYIVYGDSSTWLKLMWKWLGLMDCNIDRKFHVSGSNQCIELSSPGYMRYYSIEQKFVRFSKLLLDRIHSEGLEPDLFEQRFGINITEIGWNKWCEKNFEYQLKF